ncbi:hypothetical protein Plhal304r1_c033g0105011 [Plasmopara halstedii]
MPNSVCLTGGSTGSRHATASNCVHCMVKAILLIVSASQSVSTSSKNSMLSLTP